jgi:hypothetical protein
MRFTPNPGSWFAHQHDDGTGVEVYPAGTELRPAGPEGAGFAMTEPLRPRYNPTPRSRRPATARAIHAMGAGGRPPNSEG